MAWWPRARHSSVAVAAPTPDTSLHPALGGVDPSPPALDDEAFERVRPAVLTFWGRFKDAAVEADYRVELRASLTLGMIRVLTFAIVITPIVHGISILRNSGALSLYDLIGVVFCGVTFLLLALLLATRRSKSVPLAAIEAAAVVWFTMVLAKLTTFFPTRLEALEADALETAVGPPAVAVLLRTCAVMIMGTLFTTLQLPHVLCLYTCAVATTVAGEVLLPMEHSSNALQDIALVVLLSFAVSGATLHRHRVERQEWHHRHEIIRAAREWRATKRAELEAVARAHEADVATQARARLIRVVMHDLRSPLLAVRNMADALADLSPDTRLADPFVQRCTSAVHTCTTLMEQIVSDMLDFERIDSGHMALVPAPFLLAQLIADAELAFASLAGSQGVRLSFEPLPPALATAALVGDERRLLQCLSNGLSNASKFTERGGHIHVSVASGPQHTAADGRALERVLISVQDDGIGLAPDELALLRSGDVFQQVGRGQLQGNGGTGLGLNIVRQILQLHDESQLHMHSDGLGLGTRFEMELLLPRAVEHEAVQMRSRAEAARALARASAAEVRLRREASQPSPGSAGESRGRAPRGSAGNAIAASNHSPLRPIATPDPSSVPAPAAEGPAVVCLHVEDDLMLQMTLGVRLFGAPGVECDVASDGREALELVARRAAEGRPGYDLVVMDNQMPHMGGMEATKELRARGFGAIIIGMTGDPIGSPDRSEFAAAGLTHCVDKTPDGMALIADEINQLLRTTRAATAWPPDGRPAGSDGPGPPAAAALSYS